MTKYYVFRKLLDFIAEEYEISDADMNNYCGGIEIYGEAEDGSTIQIKVCMTEPKEEETDGN